MRQGDRAKLEAFLDDYRKSPYAADFGGEDMPVIPSPIDEESIRDHELMLRMDLPPLFRAYLRSWCLPNTYFYIGELPRILPENPFKWVEYYSIEMMAHPFYRRNERLVPFTWGAVPDIHLCFDMYRPTPTGDYPIISLWHTWLDEEPRLWTDLRCEQAQVHSSFSEYFDHLHNWLIFMTAALGDVMFGDWLEAQGKFVPEGERRWAERNRKSPENRPTTSKHASSAGSGVRDLGGGNDGRVPPVLSRPGGNRGAGLEDEGRPAQEEVGENDRGRDKEGGGLEGRALMFEIVHTVPDWYDGPRGGIADYQGRPHVFESEWSDAEDLDADTFLLMPIDAESLDLALEQWAIWRRWESAFHRGFVTREAHPALPSDRVRHEELERLLEGRLKVDPARSIRAKAEFRARIDPGWDGSGWRPLEVCWSAVE